MLPDLCDKAGEEDCDALALPAPLPLRAEAIRIESLWAKLGALMFRQLDVTAVSGKKSVDEMIES